MALDMGAGAGGAEMLQDVLRRKMVEAQGRQELALREREFQQRAEMQRQQMESVAEARQAAQVAQQAVKAQRVARVLSPGQSVDAATVGALQAGDMGDLVQHQDATLGSRNISGMVQGGKAPRIMGLASTANPGDPASDTFTGTADQLAARQAREDRQAEIEQGRQDRTSAASQAKADREDMIRLTASLRPAPQANTHARFNIVQGADANGKPAMIRTNVDTGDIEVLPVPAGANFVKRDQPATADQTNLAIYSSRISQAEPSLKSLEGSISKMNPLSFKAQTYADDPYVQSKEMQQYSQAARQFVNSVLRRESGAAISQSEFDSARKQYLPMPGDDPHTLAMKAAARADVIAQFQKGAGPAGQHPPAAPGGGDAAARVAELLKKYGGG